MALGHNERARNGYNLYSPVMVTLLLYCAAQLLFVPVLSRKNRASIRASSATSIFTGDLLEIGQLSVHPWKLAYYECVLYSWVDNPCKSVSS
jgi:hypothetical protein